MTYANKTMSYKNVILHVRKWWLDVKEVVPTSSTRVVVQLDITDLTFLSFEMS